MPVPYHDKMVRALIFCRRSLHACKKDGIYHILADWFGGEFPYASPCFYGSKDIHITRDINQLFRFFPDSIHILAGHGNLRCHRLTVKPNGLLHRLI